MAAQETQTLARGGMGKVVVGYGNLRVDGAGDCGRRAFLFGRQRDLVCQLLAAFSGRWVCCLDRGAVFTAAARTSLDAGFFGVGRNWFSTGYRHDDLGFGLRRRCWLSLGDRASAA